MKKLLCILTVICILALSMGSVVMAADETAEEINLALATNGATVTAEGTKTGFYPEKVIDGVTDTGGWQATGSDTRYVQVKLAKPATVDSIVFFTQHFKTENYTVSYSLNGTDWTTLSLSNSDRTTITDKEIYKFTKSLSGVVAQYIRVTTSVSNYYIREIEVYGKFTALPYLKSLTASTGTFTSAFDMNTTSYKVQVEDFKNLPTLSYETYISDVQVAYTEASAENEYTAKIAVTHEEKTKTYTVQFVKYNWALSINGATATAEGTKTGFYPEKVIDGVTDTGGWQATGSDTRYVQVKLAKPATVDSIVFFTQHFKTENYTVSYSLNGTDWTTLSLSNSDRTTITDKEIYKFTKSLSGVVAQYIRVTTSVSNYYIREIEVYGKNITEEYTTNCVISENKLVGNVVYLNKTQASVNDKYYLMAVYVDNAIYEVIPVNKSENTIATGVAANTILTSSTLPESGTVTAKLFVWDTPGTLVPVIEPLTLR